MVVEYFNIFFFIIFTLIISFVLLWFNNLIIFEDFNIEKNSPYECGFQPFILNLQEFDVKYFLVALLFLIFDLEVIFLIPFISVLFLINAVSFLVFLVFIIVLFFSLYYEWVIKAFDWE